MFKTLVSKALLAAGAVSLIGGGAVGAVTLQTANAATTQTAPAKPHKADRAQGVIVKLSDTEMTVERHVKKAKDDLTFELNKDTAIYRSSAPKNKLGLDALKVGERVRVRYAANNGQKVAKRIVILPDERAGRVISKGADNFVLHTRMDGDVKVTITDKTSFHTRDDSKHRRQGSFADLKVGDRAVALGEGDGQNFNAVVVGYWMPDHSKTSKSPGTHN